MTNSIILNNDIFSCVLSFLEPRDLATVEHVSKAWKAFVEVTEQWKKQCQYRLNIPTHIDPKSFLPVDCYNYKKGLQTASHKVFDAKLYRYYLGVEIGPVPTLFLKKRDEQDPCDTTQTVGRKYTWFYSPDDFEITIDENFPYALEETKDAPRLVKKESVPFGTRTLTVPNTINNLKVLFQHPKHGNFSTCYFNIDWDIFEQHGNKKIAPGWVCMREEVIGKGQSFSEQQAFAEKAGVVIPPLLHRTLFNFLKSISSGKTHVYADGSDSSPWTHARTSTLTQNKPWGCGPSYPFSTTGLYLIHNHIDRGDIGVAVALPDRV